MKEIKNANIENTSLGFEGHGIMTCWLHLGYGGSGQGFGGYDLRDGKYLAKHIERILQIVGVEKWEDLRGKYIRVEAEMNKVHRIGNLLTDQWFDPTEI
jgi:hypothetical protein